MQEIAYHFFFSTFINYTLLYINVGDYMKKRFKAKKKFKYKLVIIPFLLIISIYLINYCLGKVRISLSNENIIELVFNSENKYSIDNVENKSVYDKIIGYLKENIFNNPVEILKGELDYSNNKISNNEIISFSYKEPKKNRIYIYSSHQGETYSMEYLENHNIVPDILMASHMLEEKLENIGINTIVEESDILSYMKENNLNHASSYIASRKFLTEAMDKYKDIELFIDLHRDAATHKATYTSIDGKDCAKVLFVIGLENENYQKNLDIVTKINNIIDEKYPTLSRGIMKKQGAGVNGVYNQDLKENVILIELGGNENNIDEINNTTDIIAKVLEEYLNEKEEK